jgi:hypothetical protein
MREDRVLGRICTFPEDFIISLLDLGFYSELNNKKE